MHYTSLCVCLCVYTNMNVTLHVFINVCVFVLSEFMCIDYANEFASLYVFFKADFAYSKLLSAF